MFLFGKKKPEGQILEEAVLKGIQEAKAEREQEEVEREQEEAKREQEEAKNKREQKIVRKEALRKAYNAASGLLDGLSRLSNQPGSKFKFKTVDGEESLEIETNIPAYRQEGGFHTMSAGSGKVVASVEPDGRIRVDGDARHSFSHLGFSFYTTEVFSSKRRDATEKALILIAKTATLKGLIS